MACQYVMPHFKDVTFLSQFQNTHDDSHSSPLQCDRWASTLNLLNSTHHHPAAEAQPNPSSLAMNVEPQLSHAHEASQYEQSREQRIKENLERMKKLGIMDLSLKFKADSLSKRKNGRSQSLEKRTPAKVALPPSGPTRRSSRLQNVTPVSYSEVSTGFVDVVHDLLLEKGAKPEFYTEEHEKLLGDTQRSWTLFVDGYSSDGRRIYDPVKGKTCHQCRQKTLGLRTHCSQCQMVQGQFCGDCLYMRYGEHVVEANENPEWICPACRGICNCSLCRQAKGWPPTGALYRRIQKLGFKSVAHYLIQNNRAPSGSATKNDDTPHSAMRSLAFTDLIDEEGSKKEEPPKPVSGELRAAHEDNKKEENEDAYAMSKLNAESIPAAPTDERKPEGVAGRTRKRSNSEILKRIEGLKKEETATKDIVASTSSSSGQDSIARRLRPRSCKP